MLFKTYVTFSCVCMFFAHSHERNIHEKNLKATRKEFISNDRYYCTHPFKRTHCLTILSNATNVLLLSLLWPGLTIFLHKRFYFMHVEYFELHPYIILNRIFPLLFCTLRPSLRHKKSEKGPEERPTTATNKEGLSLQGLPRHTYTSSL